MIVLVGFMGAGKTAVGRLLARELSLPFTDTDEAIERRAGAPIAEIFTRDGEPAFRALEREVAAEALSHADGVVALGGGALSDPLTFSAMEWGTVVHLNVSFTEAMRRIGGKTNRPMLERTDPKALFDQRKASYERVADIRVDTDGVAPDAIARDLAARLAASMSRGSAERRIRVAAPSNSYEVVVGAGVVGRLDELLSSVEATSALVVTHPALREHVAVVESALAALGLKVDVAEIPEGERSKSLDVAGELYARMTSVALHRRDLVVSVGGGVICDLAGFVASTFNRGMPLVHLPTTLLAQVDAAIGGKTGVNLNEGKNLVGTFHQPELVVCDVSLLATLPHPEMASGLAEVIKYGLIADPSLLDLMHSNLSAIFDRDPEVLTDLVCRSVAIKARYVAGDETEQGIRAHLNYGHTFGHAIETAGGYTDIRHGEAISLGMMAAAYTANEAGMLGGVAVDRHRESLAAAGLPVSAQLDLATLRDAWMRDKKYRDGVRFVLLLDIGRPQAGVAVPDPVLEAALGRMDK